VIASLDATFKAGSSSDFAALTVWGQDSSGLWLLDVVNRRMSFTDTLAAIAAVRPTIFNVFFTANTKVNFSFIFF
jgi:phage terminase large subunit-like protein